jgi:hypothetical protein
MSQLEQQEDPILEMPHGTRDLDSLINIDMEI